MSKYARVINNEIRGIKYSKEPLPIKGLKKVDGLFVLRPIEELEKPKYDPETQKIRPQLESEMEIKNNKVIQGWVVEELKDWEKRVRIRRKLAELDPFLPRCLEDLIEVLGDNVKKNLPKIMKERIAQKEELRNKIRSLADDS